MRARRALRVALAAAALAAPGCKREASTPPPPVEGAARARERPVLGELVIEDRTPPPGPAALDVEELRAALRVRVLRSGLFASPDAGVRPGQGTTRIRIEIALDGAEVKQRGLARVAARVRIETRPSDAPGAVADDLEGRGEVQYARRGTDRSAVFGALAARTVGDLLEGVAARVRLRQAPPAALHAALAADAGDLREEAIRQIGVRKVRSEVPALLALLDHPDERIRDAALGALVEMREPRAVQALTKSRSLEDKREVRKILDAVAAIGGREAEEYLDFVAESHDDEEIRDMAAAARKRMTRRPAP